MKMRGGCLCGQVRYEAEAEPVFTGVCHCHNCQKYTGSAFSTVVAIPKSGLSISGTLKSYSDRGGSGNAVWRRFCPECGSAVVLDVEIMPDLTLLNVGSLEDASWFTPMHEIFCDSAQPWVKLGGNMQRFPGMPG